MNNSNIIHIESSCHFWKTVDTGFSYKIAKEFSVIRDFRCDCGFDGLCNFFDIPGTVYFVVFHLRENFESFFGCFFISENDLTWMKSHSDEVFSMAEELSSQSDSEIGGISAFLLLHFAGHDQHFGGWMLNLQFFKNSGCIAGDKGFIDVVDDHFLHG